MNKLSDYKEILIIVLIVWIVGLLSNFLGNLGYKGISNGLKGLLIFMAIWLAYCSNKIINKKKEAKIDSIFNEPKLKAEDKDNK